MVIVDGIETMRVRRKAEEEVAKLPGPEEMTQYLINDGGTLVMPDIEFTYPSGHKRRGFYLDPNLKANLDEYFVKSVAAKWDGVFLVTGMEGSGKTTWTSSALKYLDPTFPGPLIEGEISKRHCDRIVYTPDQFLEAVDKAQPMQAIQCDEAVLEFLAGDAATAVQKLLMKKMVTIRKKRLYIAFVIPSIFSFKKEMAVRRTVFLVHTYSPDRIERGFFKFYNYDSKRQLFIKGKRDDNQNAHPCDFVGRFTDTEGLFFDLDEYDAKKNAAIESLTTEKSKDRSGTNYLTKYKMKGHRDLLLLYLFSILEGSEKGTEQLNELIRLHNEARASNYKVKYTTENYSKFLKDTFDQWLYITGPTLRRYLKDAQDFLDKPLDPIVGLYEKNGVKMEDD